MISIDAKRTPADLLPKIGRFWELSGEKIRAIGLTWNPEDGSPVFTVNGRYTTKGWTEWTQGFQFGAAILQYDATNDPAFLEMGRDDTVKHMAPHVSHMGVHDHGFNNVSRPRGWDNVPEGQAVPCGESSMRGDYHAREAVLYVERLGRGGEYLAFT
jgi:hypothetical protein